MVSLGYVGLKYIAGQKHPGSVNACRFKYVAGRGSWRKKRVLAEPLIYFSGESYSKYIQQNIDSDNIEIIDILGGAMSLYDNRYPKKDIISLSKKEYIWKKNVSILLSDTGKLCKKVKRVVKKQKLKDWKVFACCGAVGVGGIILTNKCWELSDE